MTRCDTGVTRLRRRVAACRCEKTSVSQPRHTRVTTRHCRKTIEVKAGDPGSFARRQRAGWLTQGAGWRARVGRRPDVRPGQPPARAARPTRRPGRGAGQPRKRTERGRAARLGNGKGRRRKQEETGRKRRKKTFAFVGEEAALFGFVSEAHRGEEDFLEFS